MDANEPVDCKGTKYDLIDERVLTEAYNISVKQEPIRIPTETLTKLIGNLVNAQVTFVGLDLGTDQYLKIGLVADRGSPMNFDSSYSYLSMYPRAHWGIMIDKNLITPAIQAKISEEVRKKDPSVSMESTQVAYTHDGFEVDSIGRMPWGLCGTLRFSFNVIAKPAVCKNSAGKSALRMCAASSEPTPLWASDLQKVCVGVSSFLTGIADIVSDIVGAFTTGGVGIVHTYCPGYGWDVECSEMAEIQFSTGTDVLYATQINTDNMFFIVGRSQLMDSRGIDSPPSLQDCSAQVCP